MNATTAPTNVPLPCDNPPMPRRPAPPVHDTPRTAPEVYTYLENLEHPQKPTLMLLRQLILDVDPEIHEGIKWNAPSFRTSDWFATLNLRARSGEQHVWLILHTGAKQKASPDAAAAIPDPAGLLEWLGKDRAVVTFTDTADIANKREPLQAILRAWVARLA